MRGDGRVFKRGATWWLAYFGPDGKEIRESSASQNEAAAKKLLRRRLQDVANHRRGIRSFAGPAAEKLTVADLMDALESSYRLRQIKSLKRTLCHAAPVREFFGDYRALAVTTDLIREFIEKRKADGLAPASINRQTQILAAAFSLAFKEQKIATKVYVPHLSETGNARAGFFEVDEHQRMLAHLPEPMASMAEFAFRSGWRKEEIRTLTWDAVDRGAKEVRLFDSKNGSGRVLPLDDEGWQLFEKLWAARQYETADGPALSAFVFHRGDGQPVSEFYFCELWDKARRAAGLPSKLFHDYRRTAVRNLIRAGVPQTVAQAISGHKTASMFSRYNITTDADKRDALTKQREHLKATKAPASNVAAFPNVKGNER